LQHTCTPEPEQPPRAEQNREGGTRIRPASPNAASPLPRPMPHRTKTGFGQGLTDGLAKDRSEVWTPAARFGAIRPALQAGVDGSGREYGSNLGLSQPAEGREANSRGECRCYRHAAGIPQHLQGAKVNPMESTPSVVSGKPGTGKEVRATGRRVRGTLEGPAARAAKTEEGAERGHLPQLGHDAHIFDGASHRGSTTGIARNRRRDLLRMTSQPEGRSQPRG
jgi:hypothetical protein